MRPQLPRILLLLRPRPPNRFFTHLTRPQLPFLAQPRRQTRWLTTERRRWVRTEIRTAVRYTGLLWTFSLLAFITAFGVQQEYLERRFPSPAQWSWVTRKNYRSARWNEENGQGVDWARAGEAYRDLIKRLESVDGKGLQEAEDGGILVAGVGKTGLDVSNMPEPWRRGYYEVLMGAARAAEHLNDWVRDRSRNIAFPKDTVIGLSNPNPRPVPPGAKAAPLEEDCEPAFDAPETYYMRVLTTQGFTEKQKLDAALGYAAYLDYKGTPDAAKEMYRWALDIASPVKIFEKSGQFTQDVRVTSNVLEATTAMAVHNAQTGNLAMALPLFLSVLRARRSLPSTPPTIISSNIDEPPNGFFTNFISMLRSILTPPAYPAPPSDGTSLPTRTAKERCQEAALMNYIGEILYATDTSMSGRESGIAWTREAVDVAEVELRGQISLDARKTCRECLESGFGNWATMVARLADAERVKKGQKKGGWLGFGQVEEDVVGRWESEEAVVQERMRRAKTLLEEPVVGGESSLLSM